MCAFCDIAAGSAAAHAVFSDDDFMAFLDIRPLFPGHCLLIPRAHHETLPDLPEELVGPLFAHARRLSEAVPRALDSVGSLVLINNKVSQSVPHLHVHVIPRRFKDGLRGFLWPRRPYQDDTEAARVAETIASALAEVSS